MSHSMFDFETGDLSKTAKDAQASFLDYETRVVKEIGTAIGYGRVMQLCEQLWGESLKTKYGFTGGELTQGPCASELVVCLCVENKQPSHNCDWCCGTRRVTKRVREAQNA